jgi:AraC-like DNA-binding protein
MRTVVRDIEPGGRPWLWTEAVGHYDCGSEYGFTRPHGIPHTLVFLTVGGAGAFRWRDRSFVDGPGMVTVLPMGRSRCGWRTAGSRWEFHWLGLRGEGVMRWAEQLGLPFPPQAAAVQPGRQASLTGSFDSLLTRMRHRAWARSGPLQLEALALYQALIDAARPRAGAAEHPAEGRGLLGEVQRYLQRPAPSPDRVDVLAARLGITPEHLSRCMRELAGCSPKEYFLRVRVHQAEDLLRTTRLPIAEVGRRVGYPDPFHFSRLFRKRTGMTPSACRQWADQPGP